MNKFLFEIEAVAYEDGSAHPIEYFVDNIRELFEQFGYKVLKVNNEEVED